MKKKVYLETYGCQMNEYDSELVKTILKDAKYELTEDLPSADVALLNTCSVRDRANRTVLNRIHVLKKMHAHPKSLKIGILGCMATNFKQALLEDPKLHIDLIAGPDSYKTLPKLLSETFKEQDKSFDITLSEFETYSDVYPTREDGVNAWLAIMRGCNNFCTFCVVPFTRGRERSRAPESVIDEVKRLVDQGFKQVTLLGQNVNSYSHESSDFTDLMDQVSQVNGVERIRFTSPHPKDFPRKLIQLMDERENICNQIHVPLQAGNSRILKKMNRTYSKEEFMNVIHDIRSISPNMAMSTDIIVGFPTETDEEFQDTVDVVQQVEFDSAFIFKYSERPGTTAERRFPDDIPEAIKTERIVKLNELQIEIMERKNKAHIGNVERILIEKKGAKRDSDGFVGRNDANKIVLLPNGDYNVGDIISATITAASPHNMQGVPV
ncbi:tRNA (N6-isopentenyl adenosine(37)-C2)-methylthiotransferase MiaB [bacterium]|nr:tRNA (N6-isopentenyl adenosine(37)-C2)-methylthiotransferase MiaB [bacterium]